MVARSSTGARVAAVVAAALAGIACGRVRFDPLDDAPLTGCASRTFGPPVIPAGLDGPTMDITLRLTEDERTGVFWSLRAGGGDLFTVSRADRTAPFTVTALDSGINDPAATDADPTISPEGTFVVFASGRPGGAGGFDLYEMSRTGNIFGTPARIASLSSAAVESQPNWSPAESALYFVSNRDGASRIYRAQREGPGNYGPAARVEELVADGEEFDPTPSASGLVMFFRSSRAGGPGGTDAYVAVRSSLTVPFGPATLVGISSPQTDGPSFISPDLCRLYFTSDRSGTTKIYVAER